MNNEKKHNFYARRKTEIGASTTAESTIEGTVSSIVFKSKDGFTIYKFKVGLMKYVSVKGKFDVQVGELVKVRAKPQQSKYGIEFNMLEVLNVSQPSSKDDMKMFIQKNVKGMGPVSCSSVVNVYGDNTFDVLEEMTKTLLAEKPVEMPPESFCYSPHFMKRKEIVEFCEKTAITKGNAQNLFSTWMKNSKSRHIIAPIFKKLGKCLSYTDCEIISGLVEKPLEWVEEDPYRLIQPLPYKGFVTIDRMAQEVYQITNNDIRRVKAGMNYVGKQISGFCCDQKKFILTANHLMKIRLDQVDPDNKIMNDCMVIENEMVYSYDVYRLENEIVRSMHRLWLQPTYNTYEYENENLDEYQIKAVNMALSNKVCIVNGQAGTGKTTVVKHIINAILESELNIPKRVYALAPTGKAANRLKEKIERNTMTIHKLVGDFMSKRNKDDKKEMSGIFIIDEASMVDADIYKMLIDFISNDSHLILVGDAAQLSPVGRGQIFKDFIATSIKTTTLRKVHRQEKGSILDNSVTIVNALKDPLDKNPMKKMVFSRDPLSDSEFIIIDETVEPTDADKVNAIKKICNSYKGKDIRVICPRKDTCTISSEELNKQLQEVFNPFSEKGEYISNGGSKWRIGDIVLCIKNQYYNPPKGDQGESFLISNGEQGVITNFHAEAARSRSWIEVRFSLIGQTCVFYDSVAVERSIDVIRLGYAVTVHKSQGSENEIIIFAVGSDTNDFMMVNSLFYTAITRASKRVFVVANQSQINRAMVTQDNSIDEKRSQIVKKFEAMVE